MAAAAETRRSISACVRMRHLQAESEIIAHAHMRIERIGLKDHGDTPVGGIEIRNVASLDLDLTVGDILQPSDHPQQC
jgi:hypothetical protein